MSDTSDRRAEPVDRARRRRRGVILLLLLAGVGAGGYGWWKQWGRHLVFPKKWAVVEEGRIYRSGLVHRNLIEGTLREHRISTVVDLSAEGLRHPDVAAEREAASRLGIRVFEANGLDGFGVGPVDAYVTALESMAGATEDRPVLVHCAGGTERTGAAVAFYRMLFQGWDGPRAYREYVANRSDPPINDILPRYVNENLPEIAERLQKAGVLPQPPSPLPRFGAAP